MLIFRYCATLPSDGSAPLAPYYVVNRISARSLTEMDRDHTNHLRRLGSTIQDHFRCTLLLPLNCPLRDELIGRVMPSKRLAKQEVSLQACIRLHKLGELDDQHLMPLSKSVVLETDENVDFDFDCQLENSQGSDLYLRGVARLLDGVIASPFYLYLFTYEVVKDSAQPENQFDPNRAQRRMGFLSSQKLPAINPFGLYSPAGQINVGFLEVDSFLRLTLDDIKLCHRFQQFLFEKILQLPGEEQYNPSRGSYLVVPITNNRIDVDFMNEHLDSTVPDWQPHPPSSSSSSQFVDYFKVYGDAVVTAHHDPTKGKSSCYYVNAIRPEVTPLSRFPNPAYATYANYFSDRHNAIIANLSQPLLEVRKESFKTFNFLTPK